ncbi:MULTISPECIES: polysaccharide deacetylase family protein [unclassified Cyanobium]|uniref:polysaccharide deacetylase family protein n=1 Tax=unclassified Cyanobium TaxID=2627006 RepID=UPI0020CDCB54|nr:MULTISPECIES: polysaccharide deacetylase family protein [unclassified Cyanobium]MCP9834523.1 polysaccharide deacetylase family protein [Cyanobium sp. La Preciosa 7G6]MCP9937286.1 polysaccharide deacetylase family protein [Cyanobium sp. Aljojuca 7A6]
MSRLGRVANRAADLLFLPPLDRLWRRRLRGNVLCLLYHRVDQPGRVPFLDRFGVPPIPPAELAAELGFLQRRGARFLTYADLRAGRYPSSNEFAVIVSFDDGLRCNYEEGLEVLEGLGVPAVFFQSSGMLAGGGLVWEHALYWYGAHPSLVTQLAVLAQQRLALPADLRDGPLIARLRDATPVAQVQGLLAELAERWDTSAELAAAANLLYPSEAHLHRARDAGHELGSHGHRHVPRCNISAAEFEQELVRSSAVLARVLGEAPQSFSYPFNSHLPGDAQICGRHFRQVATVDGALLTPSTPALALPRFTWPGPHPNRLRRRRWLWTGTLAWPGR